MTSRAVSAVGVALLCSACGQDGQRGPGGGAGGQGPSLDAGGQGPSLDAGDKENGTFETADPIEVDSMGVFDMVDGREDVDIYSFDGRAGEWVEIRSNYFDPITFSDTRLTLFDEQQV